MRRLGAIAACIAVMAGHARFIADNCAAALVSDR